MLLKSLNLLLGSLKLLLQGPVGVVGRLEGFSVSHLLLSCTNNGVLATGLFGLSFVFWRRELLQFRTDKSNLRLAQRKRVKILRRLQEQSQRIGLW